MPVQAMQPGRHIHERADNESRLTMAIDEDRERHPSMQVMIMMMTKGNVAFGIIVTARDATRVSALRQWGKNAAK
jgi:hypothetical protein